MADLIDDIRNIAARIEKSRDLVQTEEATKNAFIMPFIAALGYDVFDPTEVTPELVADVGTKKGEKIDYAILKDSKPIMLFECKHHTANLDQEHASQLFRYFACVETRVAVLTNGIEYRFFTDLDAPNKMDTKPFLVFKITDFPENLIPELKKLTKASFDIDAVLSTANELKYVREIKSLLAAQLNNPSDDFVRFCATGLGVSRMTQAVKDQFTQLARKAVRDFVTDQLGEKLKVALGNAAPAVPYESQPAPQVADTPESQEKDSQIQTTVEEMEAYYVVKSILRTVVEAKRIFHRDQLSYFGILLDDNNRKPICRLRFNAAKQKYIGLFDSEKNEERIAITEIDDIYQHADRLKETVQNYLSGK